ncbi:hypothetical protein Tsubulata_002940 [Turnera subulata]|uniref:BAT2 N-terminal domain-containing protein n=1 Tax=Turnera subulata TaxID=218843 RepID=A0A9Q0FZ13_9ROSI|nr:hypothetical protein Tsubulata_002940 [Turnera subulata]
MTSSMLTGERRWASARRGGMTVLGKVAVPKPINLPSQRLENHGLDPNVEIVPKGTHSWGSRSSSSTSNAWGSSTLSPNTDGGMGSPSHLSGRPSSGGSGTRPSTAGSDKSHEPIASAWGANSRPSSASGTLASNQTSLTSLRPRSADTRPGSSQLSRFAEPLSDNSATWAASGMAEKQGDTSSKNDEFSLSSGDFPTLGSEKETSTKNSESQEHGPYGRPGSSSGVTSGKESIGNSIGDTPSIANVKGGTEHSWRRDNFPYGEEGTRPGMEKWHAENQLYHNSSIPPQHYDGWHGGPPVNNHPGGWYRGPPGGPPFGAPVPSGAFPMEPFPYYRPQIPPGALANPQTVPPPGAGPRGPHPKNGDMYRPHMHDAYMRPGMPLRPGFYPGPVPYEGYYGPPMGFCNSNERDIPFMGMPVPPASYNRFPGQNAPDPGNSNGRSSGYGPTGKAMIGEHVESGHSQDARGPYRVLLKHHDDGWEGNTEEQKWDDAMITKSSDSPKVDHPSKSSWEKCERKTDDKKEKEMGRRRMAHGEEVYSRSVYENPVKPKSPEGVGNLRTSDDAAIKKPPTMEHSASAFAEASSVSRDSSLIQKIEGLNAKARASDGRHDVKYVSAKEEPKRKLQTGNVMSNQLANEAVTVSVSSDQTHVSGVVHAHEKCNSVETENFELTGASRMPTTRRSTHGMRGRADHQSKGRFNVQEPEGWRKRSNGQDHTSAEAAEMSRAYPPERDDGDSVPNNSDPTDTLAQRAKLKELAKQRLKQREKEEEERTRDQKAKALAKLEELNRRTLVGEGVTQLSETAAVAVSENKPEESSSSTEIGSRSIAANLTVGATPSAVAENRVIRVEKSTTVPNEGQKVTPKTTSIDSVEVHGQSEPLQQDVGNIDVATDSIAPLVHDNGAFKQKRGGYRQKQNSLLRNNSNGKLISSSTTEVSKSAHDVVVNATAPAEDVANDTASNCESIRPVSPSVMVEASVHHRKKNRGGKNKHKAESSSSTVSPVTVSKEPTVLDTSVESGKAETSGPVSDPSSVQSSSKSKDANEVLEKHLPIPNDDVHTRPNHQWKSQHSRRLPRNPQANKSSERSQNNDAVFWAPVRPQNKAEASDETTQKMVVEAASSSIKSDQQVQNNPRNKRAEMERYVPKPVAKEMAQQVSSHQAVTTTINQSTPDESVIKGESGSHGAETVGAATSGMSKTLSTIDSLNGDGRQSKAGKGHGSWRQRGSVEANFSSNVGRNIQKSVEHYQPQNPDASSVKEQSSCSDEWNASDGWNMPEYCDASMSTISVPKDHSVTARGKRQQHKGHRSTGYNHDPDDKRVNRLDSEKVNVPTTTSEMHQPDLLPTTKDNRAFGERPTSHWQPKSQAHSTPNQRGSRSNSGQNVASEIGKGNKRDTTPQIGVPQPAHPDRELGAVKAKSYRDQSSYEKGDSEEAPNERQHEAKRERKIAPHKGRPGSPLEPPSSADFRNDHRAASGFRKNGNQNSRFGRESESHGDWSGSGKDNKQHNVPANRERQKHNTHFEYQPVAPLNSNKANSFDASKDGSFNSGSRFRERSNSNSRRGGSNFYGRQTGNARVDATYD